MNRKMPNFLLIGAQKCGTTWLCRHLMQHPEIFMSPVKDGAHLFWIANRERSRQLDYLRQFEVASERHRAIGEATTTYFWSRTGTAWDAHPAGAEVSVPARAAAELGDSLKLILSLRDPVDRALSAFIHYARSGELGFDRDLLSCGTFNGIVEMGFYACHLVAWLRHFEPGQMLILNFEQDIKGQPERTLNRVFKFLAVSDDHTAHYPRKPVFSGLPRVWRRGVLYARDGNGIEHQVADLDTCNELRNIYRADVAELDRLLGFPFSQPWHSLHSSA